MHHSTFISHLAAVYNPRVYVELGLYTGETFQKVLPFASIAYGVDTTPNAHLENLKRTPNARIHYSTTDEFFSSFNSGIDMAFIDANHTFESVLTDFNNVLSRLNPGGIILLHDTDPEADSLITPMRCGDAYKIVKLLESSPDLNITTIPCAEAGLSIVTKKNSTRTHLRNL